MNFARNFVALRKKMGLSQEQMAEKCGVSRAALAKWEVGNTVPNLYLVCDIAKIFQVSLDELVYGYIDNSNHDLLEMVNDKLDEILKAIYVKNENMNLCERYYNENDKNDDEEQKVIASEVLYDKGVEAKERGNYNEAIDYLEDALVCGNIDALELLLFIQSDILNIIEGEVSQTEYWNIMSEFVRKREQYEKIVADIRNNK